MKRIATFVLIGVGALALASLGIAYLAGPEGASTASNPSNRVEIRDYAFHPQTLWIAPGTTVTWVNRDSVPHTVTGKDGTWGSDLLAQGQEFSYTFTAQGTYEYFCEPHPLMEGRVTVGGSPDGTAATPEAPRGEPALDQTQWREQMQQHMDAMHGPGSFDAMRQGMEERWGPGALDLMLQDCPHGNGAAPGRDMMDGQGPMGGGMMGSGGMMGGPRR